MTWETYNFSEDFQNAILACLICYPEEFREFGEIIEPKFFRGPQATEVAFWLKRYVEKYASYPNFDTLGNYVYHEAKRRMGERAKELLEYIQLLSDVDVRDWKAIRDLSLSFAKERALLVAMSKIMTAQRDGKSHTVDPVKEVQAALDVGINYTDLGVHLYYDLEKVVRKVSALDYGVHTGYPELDRIWPTGFAPGWLICLLAPPKRYKCEHPDTEILMFNGTVKRICQVKAGDKIMGDDSTARTVLSCGYGYGPMYKVTQANGDNYVVNADHVLCLKRPEGTEPVGRFSNRYHTGSTLTITAEEYAQKPRWFKRTWKGYKVGVEFPSVTVPLDPYLLGLWLGDGDAHKPSITVGDHDPEIMAYLLKAAQSENTRARVHQNKTRCAQFHFVRKAGVQKNPVTVKLRTLGVLGCKHIPYAYKVNSSAIRLQLLAGLLDSDGHHAKNRGFVFVNTSKQICKDTCFVARSLGFKAFTRQIKTSCTVKKKQVHSVAYRVYIQGAISKIPTRTARKHGHDSAKASNRTTIEVKPVGSGRWFGIEIDSNRRYLHSDFTVTHNTTFALNLALNMASQRTHGGDVLYYACEISQELAMLRAISNLSNQKQDRLFTDGVDKFIRIAQTRIAQKVQHHVWFKGFPSKSATINDIKINARNVIQQHGLKPRAIFIDYAETVRPTVVNKNDPDYRKQADVYTEARALGAELGCCVIMPDRCNKDTVDRPVPSMSSFQGSFEKAGIVDVAMGLCATESEHKQNRIRYFIFLNRHGEQYLHFSGRVDPTTYQMTLDQKIDYDPDAAEMQTKGKRRTAKPIVEDVEKTQTY